ncbi:hypothetical protein FQV27_11395 [Paracoccus aurantiacus]|uniref:Uncharacterized protein n=2 Tax=Paracoccus aurantiacus TaxID=2599412 RepID=A0A5C6S2A8_9RHOB|nr:hypothetical protein FQV27_11395 [Paracoccus aurantiacus]
MPLPAVATDASDAIGAQAGQEFQSPTGNIRCYLYPPEDQEPTHSVRCDVLDFTPVWTTPPEGCDLDWGGVLWLDDKGAGIRGCVGDVVATPSAKVLEYGATISGGGIQCRMERPGVTCTNPEGHGFFISREDQRIF